MKWLDILKQGGLSVAYNMTFSNVQVQNIIQHYIDSCIWKSKHDEKHIKVVIDYLLLWRCKTFKSNHWQ